jgi:hypothetical protein
MQKEWGGGQLSCGWKRIGPKLSSDVFLKTNSVEFNFNISILMVHFQ